MILFGFNNFVAKGKKYNLIMTPKKTIILEGPKHCTVVYKNEFQHFEKQK